jgi:Protein of unknown function (DUF4236)
MGVYFRKSKKLIPGVRLNLTKRGVGISFGVKGLRFSSSTTGTRRLSANIPGTGLYYRKNLKKKSNTQPGNLNDVSNVQDAFKSRPVNSIDVVFWISCMITIFIFFEELFNGKFKIALYLFIFGFIATVIYGIFLALKADKSDF